MLVPQTALLGREVCLLPREEYPGSRRLARAPPGHGSSAPARALRAFLYSLFTVFIFEEKKSFFHRKIPRRKRWRRKTPARSCTFLRQREPSLLRIHATQAFWSTRSGDRPCPAPWRRGAMQCQWHGAHCWTQGFRSFAASPRTTGSAHCGRNDGGSDRRTELSDLGAALARLAGSSCRAARWMRWRPQAPAQPPRTPCSPSKPAGMP